MDLRLSSLSAEQPQAYQVATSAAAEQNRCSSTESSHTLGQAAAAGYQTGPMPALLQEPQQPAFTDDTSGMAAAAAASTSPAAAPASLQLQTTSDPALEAGPAAAEPAMQLCHQEPIPDSSRSSSSGTGSSSSSSSSSNSADPQPQHGSNSSSSAAAATSEPVAANNKAEEPDQNPDQQPAQNPHKNRNSGSNSSRRRSKPQQKPWRHCQPVHDALDAASLALTTASLALGAVLCALCLQYPSLAWIGVALLGFTIAAPVAVGGIILARNHWLVVVLRYCLSVAALQRDSGMSFAAIRYRPLRQVLSGVLTGVLGLVGVVVAVYLSACYVVSGLLWGGVEGGGLWAEARWRLGTYSWDGGGGLFLSLLCGEWFGVWAYMHTEHASKVQ